jgi:hypothetical protein
MMTPPAITFVYQWTRDMPHRDISAAKEYARFLEELAGYAASPIQTIEQLREAPATDFIVFAGADVRVSLNECSIDQQPAIARRLIPINASRPRIFEMLLEPLSLAAAVDDLSMLEWKTRKPEQAGTRGLHGLREVGNSVGANCLIFQSERYCFLESSIHRGLPHLLAEYLSAYQSIVLDRA